MFLTPALLTSAPLQLCQYHYTFPLFHLHRSRHGTCYCDVASFSLWLVLSTGRIILRYQQVSADISQVVNKKKRQACGVCFFFFLRFSRVVFLDSVLNCFPMLTKRGRLWVFPWRIPACFVARGVFYLHWLLFVLNLIVINIFDLFCVYQTNDIWKLLCMVGALFDDVQIMIPLSWGCFVFPTLRTVF